MSPGPFISVVAPCYNERESVPELVRRARAACEATGRSWELVLVDDRSTDGTREAIRALVPTTPGLVYVRLSRNRGQQAALLAGLHAARGERVLIIDADLQDPPELLAPMLALMDGAPAADPVDVVYGRRRSRPGDAGWKRAAANLFYRALRSLADADVPLDTGDFRLLSRRAVDAVLALPDRHPFVRGMVAWVGLRQEELEYDREPRRAGRTHYTARGLWRLAVAGVTCLSVRPLRWAGWAGALAALVSAALLAAGAVAWARGVEGAPWLVGGAALGLLGSVQLVALGIMGEYLGRLFEQARGRPAYIVDEIVRSPVAPGPGRTEPARPDVVVTESARAVLRRP